MRQIKPVAMGLVIRLIAGSVKNGMTRLAVVRRNPNCVIRVKMWSAGTAKSVRTRKERAFA